MSYLGGAMLEAFQDSDGRVRIPLPRPEQKPVKKQPPPEPSVDELVAAFDPVATDAETQAAELLKAFLSLRETIVRNRMIIRDGEAELAEIPAYLSRIERGRSMGIETPEQKDSYLKERNKVFNRRTELNEILSQAEQDFNAAAEQVQALEMPLYRAYQEILGPAQYVPQPRCEARQKFLTRLQANCR